MDLLYIKGWLLVTLIIIIIILIYIEFDDKVIKSMVKKMKDPLKVKRVETKNLMK